MDREEASTVESAKENGKPEKEDRRGIVPHLFLLIGIKIKRYKVYFLKLYCM